MMVWHMETSHGERRSEPSLPCDHGLYSGSIPWTGDIVHNHTCIPMMTLQSTSTDGWIIWDTQILLHRLISHVTALIYSMDQPSLPAHLINNRSGGFGWSDSKQMQTCFQPFLFCFWCPQFYLGMYGAKTVRNTVWKKLLSLSCTSIVSKHHTLGT